MKGHATGMATAAPSLVTHDGLRKLTVTYRASHSRLSRVTNKLRGKRALRFKS